MKLGMSTDYSSLTRPLCEVAAGLRPSEPAGLQTRQAEAPCGLDAQGCSRVTEVHLYPILLPGTLEHSRTPRLLDVSQSHDSYHDSCHLMTHKGLGNE